MSQNEVRKIRGLRGLMQIASVLEVIYEKSVDYRCYGTGWFIPL